MNQKSQAKKITATLAAALPLALAAGMACAQTATAEQAGAVVQVAQTGQAGEAPQTTQSAATGLTLAQQQNCMSCHSVNRAFMGPAFRDVAARYASKPDAQTYLAHKIMEGSNGVWGSVPMPANTQLTPAQAATLARWVLTLK
jgi:cytochrome c